MNEKEVKQQNHPFTKEAELFDRVPSAEWILLAKYKSNYSNGIVQAKGVRIQEIAGQR